MKNISKFDLGIIIAFVVVALLGGGAWYYLSTQLSTEQDAVRSVNADFTKDSTSEGVLVTQANKDALTANIDLLKSQLTPLIESKLQPKDSKLLSISQEDPVAWKHDLDSMVSRLTATAQGQHVDLPPKFYFGFSRYLNQNPGDEQTVVLGKQLIAVELLSNILIGARVDKILSLKRTYEEDASSRGDSSPSSDRDALAASSVEAAGGAYTAYPFEVDFDAKPEVLRQVVDQLVQSPSYIFVLRNLAIHNSQPKSPQVSDLAQMAGPAPDNSSTPPGSGPPANFLNGAPPPPGGSPPGAAPTGAPAGDSVKGPQYLFGAATLHVTARIDFVDWKLGAADLASLTPVPSNSRGTPTRSRNR
jgi:hypothetical protein